MLGKRFIEERKMPDGDQPWRVDLGGGKDSEDGYLNLELRPIPEADVVASADCLPFKDDTIDAIHASSLTPHFEDLNAAFEEWSRVLKPGGELVVESTHANSTGIRADADHKNWSWTSDTPRYYDANWEYAYYTDTNLELVDLAVNGWCRPGRWWLKPLSGMFKLLIYVAEPDIVDELMKLPFAGGRVRAKYRARRS